MVSAEWTSAGRLFQIGLPGAAAANEKRPAPTTVQKQGRPYRPLLSARQSALPKNVWDLERAKIYIFHGTWNVKLLPLGNRGLV